MTDSYIGVDIAKDWIDIFDTQTSRHRRVKTTPCALQDFARRCAGKQVIFEASGGYERSFISALEDAGVAFARINPRHAREFVRATGRRSAGHADGAPRRAG